ncbi:Sin3 associated polypeptide p18-domain-containing protein [Halteromyces radiatus]|uniref:Sin3 associated polypeptide p18-domain-containing protein n=1 Tax=Halteromyces radiatus TaxID=101107 RepID=UPI0022209270|nr:Sin3 associated polypeptide p18-domain-containing protein [Halteromyces radiatus]KAI8082927.1 Sin3 associated polypeptide p18-domain-containing protein [Halteromyces radiatus]
MSVPPAITIDREKVCPFLLKVYSKIGSHHKPYDYQITRQPVEDEIQLYTWKDATLGELALLLQEVVPEARHVDARIAFRLVYLDVRTGRYEHTDIGRVVNAEETPDQMKTLDDCKFLIGDFLDVAIYMGPKPMQRGNGNRFDRRRSSGGGGGNRYSFRGRSRY